jgi:hypothetical protein
MTHYTILPKSIRDTQQRIEAAVDALLDSAQDLTVDARGSLGAINWADLTVVDVVYSVGNDGMVWYTVEISEASPECHGLHRYIYDNLNKENFPETIVVRTEW